MSFIDLGKPIDTNGITLGSAFFLLEVEMQNLILIGYNVGSFAKIITYSSRELFSLKNSYQLLHSEKITMSIFTSFKKYPKLVHLI